MNMVISPNRDPSAKSELIIPEESQRLIPSSLRGTIHGLSTPTSANYVYQESFKLQLVYNEIDNFTTANIFPFKMVAFEILSVKWLSCLPTLESGECKYLYFTLVEGSHQERCREDNHVKGQKLIDVRYSSILLMPGNPSCCKKHPCCMDF